MTSQSSLENAWILEATVQAAHGADPHWREQLNMLRPIAGYHPTTQTWRVRLGALDLTALQVLQTLFDAAHKHGTEVHLAPVAVPERWAGPVFARTAEMATFLETQAGQERPLGQLHLA